MIPKKEKEKATDKLFNNFSFWMSETLLEFMSDLVLTRWQLLVRCFCFLVFCSKSLWAHQYAVTLTVGLVDPLCSRSERQCCELTFLDQDWYKLVM